MSEASAVRSDRYGDRPATVTDPLLWSLALDVADAHAPGEDGCVQPHCAGQGWPCRAWEQAQRALTLAEGHAPEAPGPVRSAPTPLPSTPQPWSARMGGRPESSAA
ncbi:hypothetical protein [Micromonospora zhanjiangensis]|uniref:Uncharacterized protein n=1 Tax=Micromonospora zhanjiangensis TaxID=1522057 RepID=A0ABV8KW80_9ACTN